MNPNDILTTIIKKSIYYSIRTSPFTAAPPAAPPAAAPTPHSISEVVVAK